eukprot:scaffold4611_cov45-Cyclotella_meneghiniana.AAC.2
MLHKIHYQTRQQAVSSHSYKWSSKSMSSRRRVKVEVGRLDPQKRQQTVPFLSTRCQQVRRLNLNLETQLSLLTADSPH